MRYIVNVPYNSIDKVKQEFDRVQFFKDTDTVAYFHADVSRVEIEIVPGDKS